VEGGSNVKGGSGNDTVGGGTGTDSCNAVTGKNIVKSELWLTMSGGQRPGADGPSAVA